LIDARKRLTSALSKAAGTLKASDNKAAIDVVEELRRAIFRNELALYAVFEEDRVAKLSSQLLDAAMPLKTGVLTFSHIGRGSNPPIGLDGKQINRLAQDPLVVCETEFKKWLEKRQERPNKEASSPPRKARATDHAADIELKRKINRVLDRARRLYRQAKERPPMRQLAREVAATPEFPYKADTVRQILEDKYPAMKRLGIRGL